MRLSIHGLLYATLAGLFFAAGDGRAENPAPFQNFRSIFDGRSLACWDGAPGFWSAENGMLVGRSTRQHPSGVNFLIWRGGLPADFELRLELRFIGTGNSGIQYRSRTQPYPKLDALFPDGATPPPLPGGGSLSDMFNPAYEQWNLGGYQYDVDRASIGGFYEGGGGTARGYLARPGTTLKLSRDQKTTLASFAAPEAAKDPGEWHRLHIIARGNMLVHILDDQLTAMVIDEDPAHFATHGLIGIQLESTGEATLYVRKIEISAPAYRRCSG